MPDAKAVMMGIVRTHTDKKRAERIRRAAGRTRRTEASKRCSLAGLMAGKEDGEIRLTRIINPIGSEALSRVSSQSGTLELAQQVVEFAPIVLIERKLAMLAADYVLVWVSIAFLIRNRGRTASKSSNLSRQFSQ